MTINQHMINDYINRNATNKLPKDQALETIYHNIEMGVYETPILDKQLNPHGDISKKGTMVRICHEYGVTYEELLAFSKQQMGQLTN